MAPGGPSRPEALTEDGIVTLDVVYKDKKVADAATLAEALGAAPEGWGELEHGDKTRQHSGAIREAAAALLRARRGGEHGGGRLHHALKAMLSGGLKEA